MSQRDAIIQLHCAGGRAAVKSVRGRLEKVIAANGGHIEKDC